MGAVPSGAAFMIPGMVLAMALAASPQVAAIVAGMTLPDKVGQLLVPTVPGRIAADGGAGLVRRFHVGGVIYFGSNIGDAAQVAALSAGLQQAARSQPPHLPLLIGTDQEGAIGPGGGDDVRVDPDGLLGGFPVHGEVVLAAQQVVIDPGDVRDAGVGRQRSLPIWDVTAG